MAVSVPYRGATFLNGEPMFTLTGQDRFPSPIGELHFSIEVNNEKTWRAAVSVPYRGATFLNTLPDLTIHLVSFPSPIGELHFSMVQSVLLLIVLQKNSFRPLSGSYISQSWRGIQGQYQYPVSVPYRGATFLNFLVQKFRAGGTTKFPSPIGELHFSINIPWWTYSGFTVSVPYRGATFLNNAGRSGKDKKGQFPSPIGELHFSIVVAISFIKKYLVSVPYRGATFLNSAS